MMIVRWTFARNAMKSTGHTQSLTDFRQTATETLDRLNQTGEAEIITINGEARAVLLSPAVFDELTRGTHLTHDTAAIRQAIQEIEGGKGREATVLFNELRGQLLAMKANEASGTAK